MVGSEKKFALYRNFQRYLRKLYLREWLWRQHHGGDPFGNIIKRIADLYEDLYDVYEVRKDASIVPVCTVRDLIAIS